MCIVPPQPIKEASTLGEIPLPQISTGKFPLCPSQSAFLDWNEQLRKSALHMPLCHVQFCSYGSLSAYTVLIQKAPPSTQVEFLENSTPNSVQVEGFPARKDSELKPGNNKDQYTSIAKIDHDCN
jgi:hypothetical protein